MVLESSRGGYFTKFNYINQIFAVFFVFIASAIIEKLRITICHQLFRTNKVSNVLSMIDKVPKKILNVFEGQQNEK